MTVNGGLPTRGHHIEIEGVMESAESEPWTPTPRLEGSGSASKHAAVTSALSETGPSGEWVIRSKPRPDRSTMPDWAWLCGTDPETRRKYEARHEWTP